MAQKDTEEHPQRKQEIMLRLAAEAIRDLRSFIDWLQTSDLAPGDREALESRVLALSTAVKVTARSMELHPVEIWLSLQMMAVCLFEEFEKNKFELLI